MATVRNIVEGALVKIGVSPVGDAADAAEAAVGLSSYNDVLSGFVQDGWLTAHTVAGLGDAVVIGTAYHEGLKALVAVRVASAFNFAAPPDVRMQAREVLSRLAAAAFVAGDLDAKFEEGLWDTRPAEPFYRAS